MVLPKALKSLDVSALSNVAAERIVLPAGVSIGANAFGNCPNLLTIEFTGDAGDVVPEAFGSASAAVITIVGGISIQRIFWPHALSFRNRSLNQDNPI